MTFTKSKFHLKTFVIVYKIFCAFLIYLQNFYFRLSQVFLIIIFISSSSRKLFVGMLHCHTNKNIFITIYIVVISHQNLTFILHNFEQMTLSFHFFFLVFSHICACEQKNDFNVSFTLEHLHHQYTFILFTTKISLSFQFT